MGVVEEDEEGEKKVKMTETYGRQEAVQPKAVRLFWCVQSLSGGRPMSYRSE
jgi:hypothetical protein